MTFCPSVCYFVVFRLVWLCDECTWHHKTFLVQLHSDLAIKLCYILQLQTHLAIKFYCVAFCNYSHTWQYSCIVLYFAITTTLGNKVVLCWILHLQSHLAMKRYCCIVQLQSHLAIKLYCVVLCNYSHTWQWRCIALYCAITVTFGNEDILRCIVQLQSHLAIKLCCVVLCSYSHTWQ